MQTVITLGIVTVSFVYLIRSLLQPFVGKDNNGSCHCPSAGDYSGGCHVSSKIQELKFKRMQKDHISKF